MTGYPTPDCTLARRLERAEAAANAAFVDARALVDPTVGATWIEVAGVYAMFDGAGSPLTQTFGLGLFDPFLEREFDIVESFFNSRGSTTMHETSSFADAATTRLLEIRGYTPIEQSTVLVRPTSIDLKGVSSSITVRRIDHAESDLWARVSAAGWGSESQELTAFVKNLGRVSARARGVHCFVAEIDGRIAPQQRTARLSSNVLAHQVGTPYRVMRAHVAADSIAQYAHACDAPLQRTPFTTHNT